MRLLIVVPFGQFRDVVIEMFCEKDTLLPKEIGSTLEAAVGERPPRKVHLEIMRELAVRTKDKWEMKSGGGGESSTSEE